MMWFVWPAVDRVHLSVGETAKRKIQDSDHQCSDGATDCVRDRDC